MKINARDVGFFVVVAVVLLVVLYTIMQFAGGPSQAVDR